MVVQTAPEHRYQCFACGTIHPANLWNQVVNEEYPQNIAILPRDYEENTFYRGKQHHPDILPLVTNKGLFISDIWHSWSALQET